MNNQVVELILIRGQPFASTVSVFSGSRGKSKYSHECRFKLLAEQEVDALTHRIGQKFSDCLAFTFTGNTYDRALISEVVSSHFPPRQLPRHHRRTTTVYCSWVQLVCNHATRTHDGVYLGTTHV